MVKPWEGEMVEKTSVYFEKDGIVLYHGDCADISIEADLILTDPPYGREFRSNKNTFEKIEGDDDLEGVTLRLLQVIKKLRNGSTLVAALLEGRRAVGCEFEERYCEIAARRIEKGE